MCVLRINDKLNLIKVDLKRTRWFILTIIIILFFFGDALLDNQKNPEVPEIYYARWGPVLECIIIYLLLALLIVVKVSQCFKGAISKN